MSMQPKEPGEIPAETVRVAGAAFPKGSLAIRVRDELGPMFRDEDFADLFASRGRPAWSPAGLALVSVLQFVEGLTDRQAAEAVRARIDFKYALGLHLDDPGFDFSVLSEFRARLAGADGGRRVMDGVLVAARDKGLLKSAGRARTDSSHVLSSARQLCWLEQMTETLRAALNALAQAAPHWLSEIAEPDWFKHYATRAEDSRFPKARAKRDEAGARIGRDGTRLLEAVLAADAPAALRALDEVEILRRVWVQHFHQVDGEVTRRGPKDRPPGSMRLVSPYDPEARVGVKRDTAWDGYKVHLTETCGETDVPNLVVNVATTVATVADNTMNEEIHTSLAARDCLPAEHWVDAGYPTAAHVLAARTRHGVELHGPLAANTSQQAKGAFGIDAFTIDWEHGQATCPNGADATQWYPRTDSKGLPVIRVRFPASRCGPCPDRASCINSAAGRGREIMLRQQQAEHDAIRSIRAEQQTGAWKERYKIRAGVEGTISQAVGRCGLRRTRYRGLAKTRLQHQLTGAALNRARIDAHLTGTPQARTRTSHFAALCPVELTHDRAQTGAE
ncbi:IS1182 family transposase [Streptomyces arboris]|uniref:IS1182 family transposase n=1 Tax=Streptomyces arboris TaxID=2600619 RepID=A0A5N5EGK9_9ACTN|nr:IS1182 family transposase [Streptomyces arboris]KAB2588030.1 IS1182 family transposase [Streptomyces arboris]